MGIRGQSSSEYYTRLWLEGVYCFDKTASMHQALTDCNKIGHSVILFEVGSNHLALIPTRGSLHDYSRNIHAICMRRAQGILFNYICMFEFMLLSKTETG